MIRLKKPLSVWMLRFAFLAAAATVIPACGRASLAPLTQPFSIDTASLAGGTVGVAYTQTLTTVSQTDPVAWSLFSGSLPPGLSLGAATGAITGTPTGSASLSTVTVRAIDALGQVAQRSFQITISGGAVAPLTITTATPLPGGDLSTFYSFGFSASGGAPGYTWALAGGSLPTGLALNPANGGLSGLPTVAGLFNFTIQVTDTALTVVTKACALTISPALTITSTTLPQGSVGGAYTQPVPALAGTAPLLYSLSSGSMPAGLALNAGAGTVTGTPTLLGPSTVVIRVTDSAGVTQLASLSILINPAPIVTPVVLPPSTQGLVYTQALAATLGTGAYTWTVSAGALPNGLTLSSGGVISGTSTAAGTFNFTVTVTDAANGTGSLALSILINPPIAVTTAALQAWTDTRPGYSQTLAATGGTGALAWSISVGTLPTGLTLNPATGAITGTPTGTGTANITVRATDTLGATGTRPLFIIVNALPVITTATLPDWTQNLAYTPIGIANTGGTAPFGWSVTTGGLPAAMTLGTATGIVGGTPTGTGSSTFTLQLLDAAGAATTQSYTIVINAAMVVTTGSPLAQWTQNKSGYSQTLAVSGGTGAKTWSGAAGLPAGITMSTGGVISGTPTAAPGTFNFNAIVTDSVGATANKTFDLQINPPVAITSVSPLAPWTQGQGGYSVTLAATGGTGVKTWSITSGTLPAGLTLTSATGVISGTPTTAGTSTAFLQATDTVGATAPAAVSLSITINPPLVITSSTPLAPWTQNQSAYSQPLTATGGTGTQTWSQTSGTLPTGLTFNTSGSITGAPTGAPATYTIFVQVTDTTTATAPAPVSLSITVNAPLAITSTSPLAPWTQGFLGYSQTLTATGGTGTRTWTQPTGTLPNGLSLSSAGVISGTPSAAGLFTFTVQVADTTTATAPTPLSLSITINPPVAITTVTPLAQWTRNQPGYSVTLASTGGTGGNTWTMPTGTLPAGLTMTTAGVISGTPTAAGTSTFTVQATDVLGATAPAPVSLSITINPPLAITSTSPLAAWTRNFAGYNQTLTATGGTGTKTWTQTSGTLPVGLTFNGAAGTITGTPTDTAATYTIFVQVTDTTTATAPAPVSLSITINPPLLVTTASPLAQRTQGLAGYSQTVAASGGTGTQTWSLSPGPLPTGLLMDSAGAITGTPSAAGTFGFTVLVTDAVGATATKLMSITINAPPSMTTSSPLTPWTQNLAGYSVTLVGAGGTGGLTWSNPSGSLPAGLTLTAGVIGGTPTGTGTSTFNLQLTDGLGATTGPVSFSITINPPPSMTSASPLTDWTQNIAGYSVTLVGTGGTGGLTWSNPGGGLPAGLTLTAGVISGTPTATGLHFFNLQLTDGLGATTGAVSFLISINPPPSMITSSPLSDWTQNYAGYFVNLASSGGTGSAIWSNPGGGLPAGLTLTAGVISGTPTGTGTSTFNLQLTDGVGATTGAVSFSITINPQLNITTSSLGAWTQFKTGFLQTLAATGGTGPKKWVLFSGSMPVGLLLDTNTGVLSGTPTGSPSSYAAFFQVTDSIGATALTPDPVGLTLNGPVLFAGPLTLPAWTVNQGLYSASTNASGGTGSLTWSNPGNALALTGFSLNTSTGAITGTATSLANGYSFLIHAQDTVGAFSEQTFSITLNQAIAITSNPTLPGASQGIAYSFQFFKSNGTDPVAWTSNQAIPGLTFSAGGQLFGTPTTGGTYSFNVTATDIAGSTQTLGCSLFVLAPLIANTPAFTPVAANSAFTQGPLSATGGRTPYTWSLQSGTLPGTIAFDGTGAFTGSAPASNASSSFVVRVTDADGRVATQTLTITVTGGGGALAIGTASLAQGTQNAAYSAGLSGTGGTAGSYVWSVSIGTLPAGLNLNTVSGFIFGNPSAAGTTGFTIQLFDGTTTVTQALSITVNPPLAITTSSLAGWTVNQSGYSAPLANTGGTAPFVWSVANGLPPGLTVSAASIAGTPTSVGTYPFLATITDATGTFTSAPLQVSINPPPLVAIMGLAQGSQGVAYPAGVVINVIGGTGTAPLTWSSDISNGTLAINASTGALSGTPANAGTSNPTITVTDASGKTDGRVFSLTINVPPSVSAVNPPDAPQGLSYVGFQFNASGGTLPLSFSVASGPLPTGLTLSSGGFLSGTATSAAGAYPFTVRATDSLGAFGEQLLQISVTSGPTVISSNPNDGQTGVTRGTHLRLNFSTPMNQSTFTSSGATPTVTISPPLAMPIPILFFWNGSGDAVTLVFDTQLPAGIYGDDILDPGQLYTVTLGTGIQSLAGNNLTAPILRAFTTQTAGSDPTFTLSPDPNDPLAVGENTFTLTFSHPMNTTAGKVQIQSITGFQVEADLSAPGADVASITWDPPINKTLIIVFNSGLPANGVFRFKTDNFNSVSNGSVNGNDHTILTTPGPAGPPIVTGILPASAGAVSRDSEIAVGFTAPMRIGDLLDPTMITVTGPGVGAVQLLRETVEFSGVFLRPLSAWPANTTVTVTVSGSMRGANGEAIGSDQVFTFLTNAGSPIPFTIDVPFSTLVPNMTDLDVGGPTGLIRFVKGGNRAFINRQTLAPRDVSLVDHVTGVPLKGFTLDGQHGLEIQAFNDFTGMDFSTAYDFILNPTLLDSQGAPISVSGSANIIPFTTRASGGGLNAARPVFNGGETTYTTDGAGGVKVNLELRVRSNTGSGLSCTAVDSPNSGFTPTFNTILPSFFSSDSFQYETDPNPFEPSLTPATGTPGPHVLTYTVHDGVHDVSVSEKAFSFDATLYPTLTVPGTPSATPTLSWTGISAGLGADGMAIIISGPGGAYVALLPPTATSFTLPADQTLPTGSYKFRLHFFHGEDGSLNGSTSEADTNDSTSTFDIP